MATDICQQSINNLNNLDDLIKKYSKPVKFKKPKNKYQIQTTVEYRETVINTKTKLFDESRNSNPLIRTLCLYFIDKSQKFDHTIYHIDKNNFVTIKSDITNTNITKFSLVTENDETLLEVNYDIDFIFNVDNVLKLYENTCYFTRDNLYLCSTSFHHIVFGAKSFKTNITENGNSNEWNKTMVVKIGNNYVTHGCLIKIVIVAMEYKQDDDSIFLKDMTDQCIKNGLNPELAKKMFYETKFYTKCGYIKILFETLCIKMSKQPYEMSNVISPRTKLIIVHFINIDHVFCIMKFGSDWLWCEGFREYGSRFQIMSNRELQYNLDIIRKHEKIELTCYNTNINVWKQFIDSATFLVKYANFYSQNLNVLA